VGVEAARVRQYPDAGVRDRGGLAPDAGVAYPERRPVRGDAEDGQPPGAVPPDLRRQDLTAGDDLGGGQLVGTGRPARHEVRDALSVPEQEVLLGGAQLAGHEPGPVQRRPEAVAGAGEVVAGGRRVQARVDAAEQHVQAGSDDVGDGPAVRGRQLGGGRRCGHAVQPTFNTLRHGLLTISAAPSLQPPRTAAATRLADLDVTPRRPRPDRQDPDMLRLSRLVLLAAVAGAIALGATVANHRPDASVAAAFFSGGSSSGQHGPPKNVIPLGHYWS
jgi:hypothetical protein